MSRLSVARKGVALFLAAAMACLPVAQANEDYSLRPVAMREKESCINGLIEKLRNVEEAQDARKELTKLGEIVIPYLVLAYDPSEPAPFREQIIVTLSLFPYREYKNMLNPDCVQFLCNIVSDELEDPQIRIVAIHILKEAYMKMASIDTMQASFKAGAGRDTEIPPDYFETACVSLQIIFQTLNHSLLSDSNDVSIMSLDALEKIFLGKEQLFGYPGLGDELVSGLAMYAEMQKDDGSHPLPPHIRLNVCFLWLAILERDYIWDKELQGIIFKAFKMIFSKLPPDSRQTLMEIITGKFYEGSSDERYDDTGKSLFRYHLIDMLYTLADVGGEPAITKRAGIFLETFANTPNDPMASLYARQAYGRLMKAIYYNPAYENI